MCAAMVTCRRLIYTLMGHIPAISGTSSTGGHYHSLSSACQAVFSVIRLATLWWNTSSTFNISPINNNLFLP